MPAGTRPLPQLVIREKRSEKDPSDFTFYFMKEKKAFKANDAIKRNALNTLNREKVLWMIEPCDSHATISSDPNNLPIFATVSPDPIRYKEVTKSVAVKMYMKPYTLNELLTIGQHMLSSVSQVDEVRELYTPKLIAERFRRYGGIIRRVLPYDNVQNLQIERELKEAVSNTGGDAYLLTQVDGQWHSDKLTSMGSYIIQWSPKLTIGVPGSSAVHNEENIEQINFYDKVSSFASDYVKDQVQST